MRRARVAPVGQPRPAPAPAGLRTRLASRALCNALPAALPAEDATDGTSPTKEELPARLAGRGGDLVPATTVHALADRRSKARQRALQLRARGVSLGYPRFKTATRWHSLPVRQDGP